MIVSTFFKNLVYRQKFLQTVNLNENCSEFEVNSWTISEFVIEHLIPIVSWHPFPIAELNLMASAVCRIRPELIFEWGTNVGKSARIFYETLKYFSIPGQIHTIDLPDEIFHPEAPHKNIGKFIKNIPEINCHRGDGVDTSIKIWLAHGIPQKTIFFLDGDHSYETINRELKTFLENAPNLPNGILIHDTFYQSERSGYNIGPYKAIHENMKHFQNIGYKFISTAIGLPGMTLIYKL